MTKTAAATIGDKKPRKKKAPSKTAKADQNVVSASVLSAILSDPPFSDRWLRTLADQGVIAKAGRGQYLLAESVRGYLRFVRETEVKKAAEASTSREMFESERARKLKLENDQRQALLVETPDALAAIDHIFGQVRTSLAGLPARLTEDVAERRRIEDAIDATLADLTNRLEQAGAALQEGRDPAEAGAEIDT